MARKQLKKFAQGGDAAQTARYARKTEDIESDYRKALKAGKSSGIARAKYEQRMADAADDLAKWTRSDRTQTRAAERAAETALSEARRTKGVSALRSQTPTAVKSMMDEGPVGVTSGMEVGRVASPSTARATPRPRAAAPTPRRDAPAPVSRRETSALAGPAERPSFVKDYTPSDLARLAQGKQDTTDKQVISPANRAAALLTDRPEYKAGRYNTPSALSRMAGRLNEYVTTKNTAYGLRQLEEDRARRAARRKAIAPPPQASAPEVTDEDWRTALSKGARGPLGLKKGGTVKKKPAAKKPMAKPTMKYAKGGSIDGCAVRGKTKARNK